MSCASRTRVMPGIRAAARSSAARRSWGRAAPRSRSPTKTKVSASTDWPQSHRSAASMEHLVQGGWGTWEGDEPSVGIALVAEVEGRGPSRRSESVIGGLAHPAHQTTSGPPISAISWGGEYGPAVGHRPDAPRSVDAQPAFGYRRLDESVAVPRLEPVVRAPLDVPVLARAERSARAADRQRGGRPQDLRGLRVGDAAASVLASRPHDESDHGDARKRQRDRHDRDQPRGPACMSPASCGFRSLRLRRLGRARACRERPKEFDLIHGVGTSDLAQPDLRRAFDAGRPAHGSGVT